MRPWARMRLCACELPTLLRPSQRELGLERSGPNEPYVGGGDENATDHRNTTQATHNMHTLQVSTHERPTVSAKQTPLPERCNGVHKGTATHTHNPLPMSSKPRSYDESDETVCNANAHICRTLGFACMRKSWASAWGSPMGKATASSCLKSALAALPARGCVKRNPPPDLVRRLH